MQNTKDMELDLDKSKEVERHFILPLKDVLLGMKLIEKDKERKVPVPYVKVEIYIPQEVGKTIGEVLKSDWRLALKGIKYKKKV